MPGSPHLDKTFFWSSPIFGRKILQKSQSAIGSTQCKSGPGNNMVCRHSHLLYRFSITIHLHLASFYATKYFWKKLATVRGMLIEQNFELREPEPPGRTCTPIAGCFDDKTIISRENFRVDCYSPLKYCWRQCSLLPPTWAKSLTKFNPQIQDFKRVLDLNCKQKKDWTT